MNQDLDAFVATLRARERELTRAQARNTELDAQLKQAKRERAQALAALSAELKSAQREVQALRTRLRRTTEQRDTHKARCAELREYVAKYQSEVVRLRPPVSALPSLPWGAQL